MKRFFSLILACFMIFALCACSAKSRIVGTWEAFDGMYRKTITFNKNGCGTIEIDGDGNINTETFEYEFKDKNTLKITSNGETEIYDISIKGDEMSFSQHDLTITYTKQK